MSIRVNAPHLEIRECRTEAEKLFVEALDRPAARGNWFASSWEHPGRVVVTVDISDEDPMYNAVVRMLRVDYDGEDVLVGDDKTFGLATDLHSNRPDVLSWKDSPKSLAERAADWLEREMARPIVRREWRKPTFRYRQWVLADTNQVLVAQDSENQRRSDLGKPSSETRVRVWELSQKE